MEEQRNILEQKFSPLFVHPEEEPNTSDINMNSSSIIDDIKNLDGAFTDAGHKIKELIDTTKLKLESVKSFLESEKERQEDMNILCNRYTDFMTAKTIDPAALQGTLSVEDGIVSAAISAYQTCAIEIVDIVGNGYEGNAYVYSNTEFLNSTIDSSVRKALTDSNLATYYEYSRITTNNTADNLPNAFNKDSTEAYCSIEIKSEVQINQIYVASERDDLMLSKVYTSQDGLTYALDAEYNIQINERNDRYNNQAYVYGSGLIAIKPARYVKIFFKSNGYTSDTVAYVDSVYLPNSSGSSVIKKVVTVEDAKRHVIKISDISAYKNKYTKGYLLSSELISDPVSTIAFCCNEYIQKDYDIANNVKYYLIVNGEEHEIQPINSHRNGKKILRMSAQNYKSDHVIYLNETIKSAKLKIVVDSSTQDVSPFISDLKILIGGESNG